MDCKQTPNATTNANASAHLLRDAARGVPPARRDEQHLPARGDRRRVQKRRDIIIIIIMAPPKTPPARRDERRAPCVDIEGARKTRRDINGDVTVASSRRRASRPGRAVTFVPRGVAVRFMACRVLSRHGVSCRRASPGPSVTRAGVARRYRGNSPGDGVGEREM